MKLAAILLAFLAAPLPLRAAEVHVVSSGGFAAAYKALAPEWEKQTGNTLITEWGSSVGTTQGAIPQRLARGERIDVLIMDGAALDKLVEQGKVASEDAIKLARSDIGAVVKQGTPQPDISTVEGLKQALLAAPSIAYSDNSSGFYIEREMFKKLGIEEAVKGKARMIRAEPVGSVVARGEAAIGLQQISELKPIIGITLLGPLPQPLQLDTIFSAGVLKDSQEQDAARSLVRFLASPAAATAITNSGMKPAAPPK